MATNIVTKNKLMSYAHDNVYDTINSRTNIVDPNNPNVTSRLFVYKNDPWSKGNTYGGYPYIIVRFPKIEQSSVSGDGKYKNITWSIRITVRSNMGGAINTDGSSKAVTDMNSIIDDLYETFNKETIKQSLRLLNMFAFNLITDSNDEYIDTNDKHILETELTLQAQTRIGVSS